MVLGINRRNTVIAQANPRSAIRLVRDKVATKHALAAAGVPAPPTLGHLVRHRDADRFAYDQLPSSWVMKPQRGSRGRGVLVVLARDGDGWRTASGRTVDRAAIVSHAHEILDGEHSSMDADGALIEPLLTSHAALASIAPVGLPDVRVICHDRQPLMAMMRLPTIASGGRGNLHQGGIGAAVRLDDGVIVRAVHNKQSITHHPDTGAQLLGREVPMWSRCIAVAAAAGPAVGLGYSGSDLVIDANLGVVVLEVNGHPGLEIQNVCNDSLLDRLDVDWSGR